MTSRAAQKGSADRVDRPRGPPEPCGKSFCMEVGQLVRALNAATEASGGLMYAIAAMIVVFGLIVVAFSFGKSSH